ncbi:unnamed protein product [Orchesella dallaii]|uniref:Uncharacterized protein n=1 Tax=Orchesella dallaii TaxID=48710 RepID=A0ABP1PXA2_9HEXA
MTILLLLLAAGVLACVANPAYDKEIAEDNCKSAYPKGHHINYFKIIKQTRNEGWMVPMSNKHLAYHTGVQMTGNVSLPEEELKEICLRISDKGVFSHHNPHAILVFCNFTNFLHANCYFLGGNPHHHVAGPLKVTVAWTDKGSHNILLVLCALEDNQPYWLLMSKSAEVESEVRTEVLSVISNLGFDSNKTLYYDQSKCTDREGGKGKHSRFFG